MTRARSMQPARPAAPALWLAPLAVLAAAAAGWAIDPAAFLACYLAAWWFWIGVCMGVLANSWLHRLTGGAWGAAVHRLAPAAGSGVMLAAVLFLPVLAGLDWLYPWRAGPGWDAGLDAPAFKRIWLEPAFFTARAVAYLALWAALAWRGRRAPGPGFAAFALIAYGLSAGLAAMDWLMSLMPAWYSSAFGLVCATVQLMAGLALAIRLLPAAQQALLPDLGNLLLTYVLCWGYLEYVQFLIIWAADLPHEIVWYLARAQQPWLLLDWLLPLLLLAVPLLLLIQRRVKRDRPGMRRLALLVLAMALVHSCWLVLPSMPGPAARWLAPLPLALLVVALLAWLPRGWRRWRSHG